jgi:hypothetical protein
MLNAIKPLVDSGIINEDTRQAITEAWEAQLAEAKEVVRGELREEFARRYQHDKTVMVEALDKMVTESLSLEIKEFKEEKQALAEDRVKFKKFVRESGSKFQNFMVEKLAEEIKELRSDRKVQLESLGKLEKFVMMQLSSEIGEFAKDKKEVVETKVRLISNAKKMMSEMQKTFVARSATLVKEAVSKSLESELTQLKEDIQVARENMFGRRLFEAFASEFTATHLNENKEIAKLTSLVKAKNRQLEESKVKVAKAATLVESKDREVKLLKESVERKAVLAELLNPLNKEKASVMSDLLENVQTNKLRSVYEKYLPAVLDNKQAKPVQPSQGTRVLSESRSAMTGDKTAKPVVESSSDNVVEIRRLAGLK